MPHIGISIRRKAIQKPRIHWIALAISEIRQSILHIAVKYRQEDAAVSQHTPVPAGQYRRRLLDQFRIQWQIRVCGGHSGPIRVGQRVFFEADPVQPGGWMAQRRHCANDEIEPGAESQLADAEIFRSRHALCGLS